jgi:hypothetical protein
MTRVALYLKQTHAMCRLDINPRILLKTNWVSNGHDVVTSIHDCNL